MVEDKDKKEEENAEDLTPEEKLFRAVVSNSSDFDEFIDDDDGEDQDSDKGGFSAAIQGMLSSLGGLFGGASENRNAQTATLHAVRRPQWVRKLSGRIRLKSINRTVGVLVVLVVIYLFYDIFFGNSTPLKAFFRNPKVNEASLLPRRRPEPVKPLNYYLDPMRSRNVFKKKEPPPPGFGEAAEEAVAPVVAVLPIPTNLRLAGISWDDAEFVAMIEIAEESSARFVHKGDKLPGEIDVENVTDSAVSLNRNGQKWELV